MGDPQIITSYAAERYHWVGQYAIAIESQFQMDLSIIVVSYNARSDLVRCLDSLRAHPPSAAHEIIVVDNASSDGSAAAARRHNFVRVIDVPSNVGFAAGNNIGIRASTGRMILLLNSDTLVPARGIDGLLDSLARHGEAAVVGPRLVNGEGRAELSFGRMISPMSEVRQRRLVRGNDSGDPEIARYVDAITRREQWTDWVSGACLLVRRSYAEAVGLLDERYFMYMEDVDFCAAIRAEGGRILFDPRVEIVHLRGRSAAAQPVATREAYRRSHVAFYKKHYPWLAPLILLYRHLPARR